MEKSKVLETIAKLSALSNDSGAFQGEISTATSKIEMLMRKYSISQMEVDGFMADEQEKEMKDAFASVISEFRFRAIKKWHWDLARIISRITYTRHYSTGKRMTFFGMENNAKVASELYILWLKNIEEVAEDANKKHRRECIKKYGDRPNFFSWVSDNHPEDDPKYFRSSWIQGCINGMWEVTREEEEARNPRRHHPYNESKKGTDENPVETKEEVITQNNAIALYQEKVDLAYQQLSKGFRTVRTSMSKGFSSSGYEKGKSFGSSIKIGSKELGG